jgi:KDO2-lipid IV(A) lauroyltransferase
MKSLLDVLLLFLVRSLVFLLAWLPLPVSNLLAKGIVFLIMSLIPRFAESGKRNLEIAFPEKSDEERADILKKSFRILARNLVCFSRVPRLTREWVCEHVEGLEEIKEDMDALRAKHPSSGLITPTLHFGCFEYTGQLYALYDTPFSVLVRPFGFTRLDRWWNGIRESHGCQSFYRNGGYREFVKRLSRGEEVCLLCDQNVKRNHAVFVDFFGTKASATKSIALAHLRTGAPICILVAAELSPVSYKAIHRIIDCTFEQGDISNEDKIQVLTQRIQSAIEDIIRLYPEQWFWIHRRWKTQETDAEEILYA